MSEFESEINTFDFSRPVIPDPVSEESEIAKFDFSAPIQVAEETKSVDEGGFFQRTSQQLSKRNQRMVGDIKKFASGKESPSEAMLNVAGELSGSFIDVVGEGLVSSARMASKITPDFIKEYANDEIAEISQGILSTEVGRLGLKAMENGISKYREFKSGNPEAARLIENTVNIGLVFAPVKVKAKSEPSFLSKTSTKVKEAADKQFSGDKKNFLETLVGPVKDLRTLKNEVPRTSETGKGPFKRSIVTPTDREAAMAVEVGKIKGITHKNSVQGNWNLIDAENKKLAKKLQSDVTEAGVKLPQQKVLQQLDDVIDEAIENNIFIVGSGVNAAEKLRLNLGKIIIKHSDDQGFISGESLLAARKELDAEVKKQKPGVFNENTAESAIEIITKASRNSLNDILDDAVTGSRAIDIKVKDELRRQSLLFGALDNMTPKAASEANTAIIRSVQNAMKVIPVRNEAVQLLAASAGVGGLGAAAMAAPKIRTAAVLGGSIYGIYKGAKSVGLKRVTSKALSLVDQAIRTTENPSMLKALRADRALIVELLENTVGFDEANKPIPMEPEK